MYRGSFTSPPGLGDQGVAQDYFSNLFHINLAGFSPLPFILSRISDGVTLKQPIRIVPIHDFYKLRKDLFLVNVLEFL
jgi:hypothetical protein